MKEANPIEFGNRVRQRRTDLGLSQPRLAELAGYSQSNIDWIEKGKPKRPHIQAAQLAEPLNTTVEWLLWEKGPKDAGPLILTEEQLNEVYRLMSPQDRAAISQEALKRIEASKKKRKSG